MLRNTVISMLYNGQKYDYLVFLMDILEVNAHNIYH